MMRKENLREIILCAFFTFYFLLFTFYASAASVTSIELISNTARYNGITITFEGEVIGDVMIRGNYAWINVNDGSNAIGIWAKKEMVQGIAYSGSYIHKGDRVEVAGIFNRACVEHGGDLDIHASSSKIINAGAVNIRTLDQDKKKFVIRLFILLVIVWILSLLKIRRKKKF